MNHEMQTGRVDMFNVKWSHAEGCYVFDCVWGCRGSDYESYAEAEAAFFGHQCSEPCS